MKDNEFKDLLKKFTAEHYPSADNPPTKLVLDYTNDELKKMGEDVLEEAHQSLLDNGNLKADLAQINRENDVFTLFVNQFWIYQMLSFAIMASGFSMWFLRVQRHLDKALVQSLDTKTATAPTPSPADEPD